MNAIVFDVGGTKIAATVISDRGEDLLGDSPIVCSTPASDTTEVFVGLMAQIIEQLRERFDDIVAWGAAFPGPYQRASSGELIAVPRNIPAMRGVNVAAAIRQHVPDLAGYIDNDLKLALWGEYLVGNAQGHDNVIGFVHSTGVSSAVIQNGEMLRGPHNNAGEIGCLLVERNQSKARPCDAQDAMAHGHLEAQIRGPVLAETFFGVDRHDAIAVRNALDSATDAQCSEIVDYFVPYVCDVLAPMCQVLEPSRIVLHGGIATKFADLYAPRLSHALHDASEAFAQRNGSVVLAADPHRAPLIGAAHLALASAGVQALV